MKIEKKLIELGITLPEPVPPSGNYIPAVRTGNLVYLSGHGPVDEDGALISGKVGSDLTLEEGYHAAQRAALRLLGTLQQELGDLDKIKRIVKMLGMVNCTPDFTQQPKVINGASDLLIEVLGENGRHARSAVGMNALPSNIAVEIELIVEIMG